MWGAAHLTMTIAITRNHFWKPKAMALTNIGKETRETAEPTSSRSTVCSLFFSHTHLSRIAPRLIIGEFPAVCLCLCLEWTMRLRGVSGACCWPFVSLLKTRRANVQSEARKREINTQHKVWMYLRYFGCCCGFFSLVCNDVVCMSLSRTEYRVLSD